MWKKKNEKKICKSVQYFQTYFLVFTFSHDLQWPLISFFFLSLEVSSNDGDDDDDDELFLWNGWMKNCL